MKKFLYYIMPFIVTPALMMVCSVFGNWGLLPLSFFSLAVVFIITSAVFGFFTSTNKKFDYLMTFIMPISLFVSMFAVGFWGKWDHSRFHLEFALEVSLQHFALISYCLVAIVTFIASYKGFRRFKDRIIKKIKTDSGKIVSFKISSVIAAAAGLVILIFYLVVPIIIFASGRNPYPSLGIVTGADTSFFWHFLFSRNLLGRIIFGATLLLLGVLGLIFRKSIFENSNKYDCNFSRKVCSFHL